MQSVKDAPFCQWISIRRAISCISLQPFQIKHESVDLLLRGDDVGREQAAEAEAVPLGHRERRAPVEPGVVEDVGAALVEDDGAVALRRHILSRVLGEAAQAVRGEGSPEIPRDGRHPRAGSCFSGRLRAVASVGIGVRESGDVLDRKSVV